MAKYREDFQKLALPLPPAEGIFLARERDVRHLIENGALVYTWLDLETTDKEWQTLEMTVASLTTTDIAYNIIADDLYEVCVPDRNVLSPEAMAITRYTAKQVRNKKRLSPQIAAAKIFEDVQSAPFRLWDLAGNGWRKSLGEDLWRAYVDEKQIEIPTKTGEGIKEFLVRHYPVLDDQNQVVKNIRIHEPSKTRKTLEMSYIVREGQSFDYEDEEGRWKIHQMDKFNLGFRNTYFDNRAMAACLFRANFPHKEIYAMNKKGLGNHAVDVFTLAITNYFFSAGGELSLKLGSQIDPETSWEKVTAKLDAIMDENTRFSDTDIALPTGVRVWDGTLHNIKKGHNQPDYDNAKSIGVHRYLRQTDPALVAHIEQLGNIDYFRRFMNIEQENGSDMPTTHPIRFIISTGDDDLIYRAVPVMILGSDDEHGKFNRVWAIRIDQDFDAYKYEGKLVTELSEKEIADMIRTQRGQPNAIFHEIHLKRHRGVVDLETGINAGLCPELTIDDLKRQRDRLIDYIDEENRLFIDKALDAWERQYPFKPPADDVPPFVEEEIWTAMGDVKYPYIMNDAGEQIRLPRIIRDLAQEAFKQHNDRVGDTLRSLLRPHPLEWDPSFQNAMTYAELRQQVEKKLSDYQSGQAEPIYLSQPYYDPQITSKKYKGDIDPRDIIATLVIDKLHLMGAVNDTTRSYEVQILRSSSAGSQWQTIPFEELIKISEQDLISLKDKERLRIHFELNNNHPTYVFGIRYAMENGLEEFLSNRQKEFYLAETAFRIHGPPYIPEPELHRSMSVPKSQQGIERIRRNLIPMRDGRKERTSALRPDEKGAYDIFIKEDGANAILTSVEADCHALVKRYPFTDKQKIIMGIDPESGHPLINIKYTIPDSRQRVTIEVPEGILDHPIADKNMGHNCFVIPDHPKLITTRHVVLEEKNTGRRFYAAEHVIFDMPDRKQGESYSFYKRAESAYAGANKSLPKKAKVISCAEIAPITKMQAQPYPIVKIDQDKLIATRSPKLGKLQRKEKLTGFIVRQYDYKFRKGQTIRLRGVDTNGDETNWEAKAEIVSKPQEFILRDILSMIDNPEKINQVQQLAFKCGFGNADDMRARLLSEFTRFNEDVLDPNNKLYFFEIKTVKCISHWTPKQPKACFKEQRRKTARNHSKLKKKPKFKPKTPFLSKNAPKPL